MRKYDEPDPWKLAEAMGIIVQVMPLGSSDKSCKGFFLRQSRKKHITINSDLPEPIQRIILAHEIGHEKPKIPFVPFLFCGSLVGLLWK